MKKKTAIIIILIAVIILIGILLYFYFKDTSNNNTPTDTTGSISFPTSINNTIFGGNDNTVNATGTFPTTPNQTADIRQIFSDPVSGSMIIETALGPKVRFVERSNGNIHESQLDSTQVIRLTNTTIPKIQEALFGKDGKTVVYRYLKDDTDTVETFSAKIKLSTSTSNEMSSEIVGSFLPTNIKSIAINRADDRILYTQGKQSGGGSMVFSANIDGSSKKQILDTKLSEIGILWPRSSSAILFTNPSYKYLGFVYELSPTSGALLKILGDANGLSPLPNTALTKILYSQTSASIPSLRVFNVTENTDSDLAIKTLSEKCVWSNVSSSKVYCAVPKTLPSYSYPDAWYQGTAVLSDNLWEINTETRSTKIIADIRSEEFGDLDMSNLSLSKDDSYLVFSNKADLSLWSIKIK